MNKLPKGPTTDTAAAWPQPVTQDEHQTPTCCHICGRRAWGVGLRDFKTDPAWLCGECVLDIEALRKIKRWDIYEVKALGFAVDAVGEYIDSIGGNTNLETYDELNQLMLCKAAVQGFARGVRTLVTSEAPF